MLLTIRPTQVIHYITVLISQFILQYILYILKISTILIYFKDINKIKEGTINTLLYQKSPKATYFSSREQSKHRKFEEDTKIYGTIALVNVDDVSNTLIVLMENPSAYGRYICSAINISVSHLADYLSKRYLAVQYHRKKKDCSRSN